MNNFKPPGVVWVIAIVVAVALAHRYLEDPFLVELIVIVAGMVLKTLNLGTSDMNQALDIIDMFKRYRVTKPILPPGPQMRSSSDAKAYPGESTNTAVTLDTELIDATVPPPRPNALATWLMG